MGSVGAGRSRELGAAVEEEGDVAPPGNWVQRRRGRLHEAVAGVRRAAQENGRDVGAGSSGVAQVRGQLRRARLVGDARRHQEEAAAVCRRQGQQADLSCGYA